MSQDTIGILSTGHALGLRRIAAISDSISFRVCDSRFCIALMSSTLVGNHWVGSRGRTLEATVPIKVRLETSHDLPANAEGGREKFGCSGSHLRCARSRRIDPDIPRLCEVLGVALRDGAGEPETRIHAALIAGKARNGSVFITANAEAKVAAIDDGHRGVEVSDLTIIATATDGVGVPMGLINRMEIHDRVDCERPDVCIATRSANGGQEAAWKLVVNELVLNQGSNMPSELAAHSEGEVSTPGYVWNVVTNGSVETSAQFECEMIPTIMCLRIWAGLSELRSWRRRQEPSISAASSSA